MSETKWMLHEMEGAVEYAKLKGEHIPDHNKYMRENNGDWIIVKADGSGRIGTATFRGKAKRGQAWQAPDPEGLANARLIAKCPEMLEALKEAERNVTMLCNYCEKELGGATYSRELVDKWRTLIREAEGE